MFLDSFFTLKWIFSPSCLSRQTFLGFLKITARISFLLICQSCTTMPHTVVSEHISWHYKSCVAAAHKIFKSNSSNNRNRNRMDWIGLNLDFIIFRMEFGEVLSYQDNIEIVKERLEKKSGTMSPYRSFLKAFLSYYWKRKVRQNITWRIFISTKNVSVTSLVDSLRESQ